MSYVCANIFAYLLANLKSVTTDKKKKKIQIKHSICPIFHIYEHKLNIIGIYRVHLIFLLLFFYKAYTYAYFFQYMFSTAI